MQPVLHHIGAWHDTTLDLADTCIVRHCNALHQSGMQHKAGSLTEGEQQMQAHHRPSDASTTNSSPDVASSSHTSGWATTGSPLHRTLSANVWSQNADLQQQHGITRVATGELL